MTKTFTINEALGMEGMPISRIEAQVMDLYDRKEGSGEYGPWSIQSGMVHDSTGDMKVVFKNLPDQRNLRGKTMVFKSMDGKHGLKGVEVKKNEYKGKTTIELHVSKAALIVQNHEEANVSLVEPSTRMPQNDIGTGNIAVGPGSGAHRQAPSIHEDRKMGLGLAKNRMTQLAGLYDLCWKTVRSMDLYPDVDHKGELKVIGSIASCLFIQGVREGLADKMPVRTLSKFYNEEAIKPASLKSRGEPADFDGDPEEEDDLKKDEIPF